MTAAFRPLPIAAQQPNMLKNGGIFAAGETSALTISADASAVTALLEHLAEVPLEVLHGSPGVVEALEQPCRIEIDDSAAAAGHLLVRLQPTDALLGLVATLRARHRNFEILEHTDSPAGPDSCRMAEGADPSRIGPGGRAQ